MSARLTVLQSFPGREAGKHVRYITQSRSGDLLRASRRIHLAIAGRIVSRDQIGFDREAAAL